MKTITRREELILLSILHLGNDAYLISIQDHLSVVTEKKVSLTSVHLPLSRLERSGMIEAHFGEATAIRGGRRKKIYRLTPTGLEELKKYKKVNDVLWANFSNLAEQKRQP